jgi:hypothetical protein
MQLYWNDLLKTPAPLNNWMLEEESPERIAARLQQEETTTLAVKSYEGMLQVQKRVDHMERLMTRNGMSKHAYVIYVLCVLYYRWVLKKETV